MSVLFSIMVLALCLWICLAVLGVLTIRIIGNVLDRLYPPDDEGQR